MVSTGSNLLLNLPIGFILPKGIKSSYHRSYSCNEVLTRLITMLSSPLQ